MAQRSKKSSKSPNPFSRIRKEFGNENYGAKQFRRDIGKLVRKGILGPKTNAKTQPVTRYMLDQIRKFRDVLSGESQTLVINPGERKYYQEQGYVTKNNVAIIKTGPYSKVKRLRNAPGGVPRFQVTTHPPGQKRAKVSTRTLYRYDQLEEYIVDYVNSGPDLKPGESLGFRFFGNNSTMYWHEPGAKQQLLNFFLKYQTLDKALEEDDPEQKQEIYQNFEVIYFKDVEAWTQGVRDQRNRMTDERRAREKQRRKEWYDRRMASMNDEELLRYQYKQRLRRSAKAEAERERRARLKRENPEAYADMLEANLKRLAKSKANKKG